MDYLKYIVINQKEDSISIQRVTVHVSGSDDDVVKLYDLTALCDSSQASNENPFTVPIGMLLYRVARNIWTNFRHRKAPVIRTLLENCLFLLDQEKHSQVKISHIQDFS